MESKRRWGLLLLGMVLLGCQRTTATPVAAVAAPEVKAVVDMPAAESEAPAGADALVESAPTAAIPAAAFPPAEESPSPAEIAAEPLAAETPEPAAAESELTSTPLLPSPPVEPPTGDSTHHRQLFNRVAAEYYPFQWVRDTDEPHSISVAMEELALPAPLRAAFGLRETGWEETPALRKAIDLVTHELERRRVQGVQNALAAQWPAFITADPAAQSAEVRALVEALVPIGYAAHEVYLQARDPAALARRQAVYAEADPLAVQWLQRVGVPDCATWSDDPYCSLLSTFPDAGAPVAAPETPTTIGPRAPLAESLKVLTTREGMESTLRHYLETVATALGGTEENAWAAANTAWKAARGPVEIFLGPATAANDLTFLLGVDHAPTSPLIAALPLHRQRIESGLKGIAPEQYQPRQLQAGPFVRVIDALLATGAAKTTPRYTLLTPRLAEQVLADDGKRVVCANLLQAQVPLLQRLAGAVAAPIHDGQVTAEAAVANAVLEQFALDLGPRVDPSSPLATELRVALASALAQWMLPSLVQDKVLSAAEHTAIAVTHVMTQLHHLRQGVSDPRHHVAVLELTHLTRQGALTREADRVTIDLVALHTAYGALLRELVRAAASPDEAVRQALLHDYAALMPDALRAVQRQLHSVALPRAMIFVYTPMPLR